MNKKKMVAWIMVLAVTFSFLSACGGGGGSIVDPPEETFDSISIGGLPTASMTLKLNQNKTVSTNLILNIEYAVGSVSGIDHSFTKNGSPHSTGIELVLGDAIPGSTDNEYNATLTATEFGEFIIDIAMKSDEFEYATLYLTVLEQDHPETIPQATPSAAENIVLPMDVATRTGTNTAHDPSIVWDEEHQAYYAFHTHRNRKKSTDLITWTSLNSPQYIATPQARDARTAGNGADAVWAPEVIKGNDGKWWVYYSNSTSSTNNSAIILAKSDDIEGQFVFDSVIVTTRTNQEPNAIDASVKYDHKTGKLWMVYGSFFGGIFLKELNPDTGRALNSSFGAKVVNGLDVEGAYLVYNPEFDYWYLFFTYGILADNYSTRVARSREITGPYRDSRGKVMAVYGTETGPDRNNQREYGNKMEGNMSEDFDGRRDLIGHNSVIDDTARTGKWFHCSRNNGDGQQQIVRQVLWTPTGWPMFNPNDYGGEDSNQKTNALNVIGTYQTAFQVAGTLDDDDAYHNVINLELKADGTVTGSGTYDGVRWRGSTKTSVGEYSIEVAGTWTMHGTNTIKFELSVCSVTLTAGGQKIQDYDYAGTFWGKVTPSWLHFAEAPHAVMTIVALSDAGIVFAGNRALA